MNITQPFDSFRPTEASGFINTSLVLLGLGWFGVCLRCRRCFLSAALSVNLGLVSTPLYVIDGMLTQVPLRSFFAASTTLSTNLLNIWIGRKLLRKRMKKQHRIAVFVAGEAMIVVCFLVTMTTFNQTRDVELTGLPLVMTTVYYYLEPCISSVVLLWFVGSTCYRSRTLVFAPKRCIAINLLMFSAIVFERACGYDARLQQSGELQRAAHCLRILAGELCLLLAQKSQPFQIKFVLQPAESGNLP